MYARGTIFLDCVPWPWGQGARPKVFKCFDVFFTKNTARRQVGSTLRVRCTHCTPWVLTLTIFPKWGKLDRTICGSGDGGCTFSDI